MMLVEDLEGTESCGPWPLVLWQRLKCPLPGSQFCASRAYESSNADELSVPAGARADVLETSDRGW